MNVKSICIIPPLLTAFASWADDQSLFDVSLLALSQIKVYSSTLHEESLLDAPSSVTVIQQHEIKSLNARRLSTLMNYVPGFQSYKSGESAMHYSYSSRGRRVGTSGREILILVDGERINDDWTGGAAFTDTYISLENAKQVEFIRGPGSSIYGSNAFLGVINIVTQDDKKQIDIGTTDAGGHNISASYTINTGEVKTSFFVKTLDSTSQSFEAYNYSQTDFVDAKEQFKLYDIQLKSEYKDLTFKLKKGKREDRDYYVSGIPVNDRNWVDYQTDQVSIAYDSDINERVNVYTKLSLNHKDYNVEALVGPDLLVMSTVEQKEIGYELRLAYNSNNMNWLNGLEVRQPDIVNSQTKLSNATDYRTLSTESPRTIVGIYSQFQHALSDQWDYIIGARFDDYSDVGNNLSPRLGLTYSISDVQKLKIFYGESFRAPTRIEKDILASQQFVASPDLKPEVSGTIEFIYQVFVNDQYFTATLFSTNIEDAVTQTATSPAQRINTGEETIEGIEIETVNKISDALSLRNSISYIFNMPLEINEESDRFITSSLTYSQGPASLNIGVNYQGEKSQYNQTTNVLTTHSGASTFSSHFNYDISQSVNVYISGLNIFDKNVSRPSKSANNIVGVPNAGRRIELGMRVDLD